MVTLAAKAPSHLIFVTTNETIDQISDLITPKINHILSSLDQILIILTVTLCTIHRYTVAFLQ